jgi:hypothetical protein
MTPARTNVRVTVSKNGPYLVTNDVFLAKQTIVTDAEGGSEAWREGEGIPHPKTYALCAEHRIPRVHCDAYLYLQSGTAGWHRLLCHGDLR